MTHLCSIEFQKVYEPAGTDERILVVFYSLVLLVEDTFLLLDALEANIDEFRTTKPSLVVEVG